MEARVTRCILLAAIIIASSTNSSYGFSDYTTDNFTVRASSPQFARKVGDLAEEYRKDLAIHWLGHELPRWPERCPITVKIEQHAGGETSFMFMPDRTGRSAPSRWQMNIFGSPERILDSVLPHEVTHTIFATHFGRPLPRWADEGACTTVEHESEKSKNHRMLIEFLQNKRGIPFNHMFAMKQYPQDILPLYAQGHSLVKYLIMQKGEQHFVNYLEAGMARERANNIPDTWDKVTDEFYGYDNLSDLQVSWIKWVGEGSKILPRDQITDPAEAIAETSPKQGLNADVARSNNLQPMSPPTSRIKDNRSANARVPAPSGQNYYTEQMQLGQTMVRSSNSVTKQFREQAYTSSIGYQPGSISRSMPIEKLGEYKTVQQTEETFEYQGEVHRDTIWR